MKIHKKAIKLFLYMLLAFLPSKFLSLIFVIIFFLIESKKVYFNIFRLSLLILIMSINILSELFSMNFYSFYILNYILFFISILPILFLIAHENIKDSYQIGDIKQAIELFLTCQIIYSLHQIIYAFYKFKSFDLSAGDYVSGTLRLPFTFYGDASNVIFTYTLIIILLIYIFSFKRVYNKILVIVSFIVIFLASVNHLLISLFVSIFIVQIFKKPIKALLLFSIMIILYKFLQPTNFNIIVERMNSLFLNIQYIDEISLKGKYLLNWLTDFKTYAVSFLFFGLGAGIYSSRTALLLTGEYVNYIHIKSISPYFENNTYYLWLELINNPPWLAGSFNYPYSSITSFIAELGLLVFIIIILFLYKKFTEIRLYNKHEIGIIVIFILISALVDNYFEYFQAWYILYLLITRLKNANINNV